MHLPEQLSLLFIAVIILLVPRLRAAYFSAPGVTVPGEPRGLPAIRPEAVRRWQAGRDEFLDAMKAVAMIAVVVVHVGYFFVTEEPNTLPGTIRMINNLLRFAIPWFLMITGAVLPAVSKRRYLAIIVPYACATIAVALFAEANLSTALFWFSTGRASIPYYYILVLLQCYLLFPIIEPYSKRVWFLPAAFTVTLLSFLSPSTWYVSGFPFVGPYLFFFCYGMAHRHMILSRAPMPKKERMSWAAIALLGAIPLIAVPSLTYNTSLFYGVALFQLFLGAEPAITHLGITPILARVGRITLWIFLTHFFLVELVYRITRPLTPNAIRYAVILTIALPASMLLGQLTHRIYGSVIRQFS